MITIGGTVIDLRNCVATLCAIAIILTGIGLWIKEQVDQEATRRMLDKMADEEREWKEAHPDDKE